jgi:hypothetical protein
VGGKAARSVAGSRIHGAFRESGRSGSTCRRKAFWAGKVVLFDEGTTAAVLALCGKRVVDSCREWATTRSCGARQGASKDSRSGLVRLITPSPVSLASWRAPCVAYGSPARV